MPRFIPALIALCLAACGPQAPEDRTAAGEAAAKTAKAAEEPAPDLAMPPADDPYVIVFLGDSLFAGFGLDEGQTMPDVFASAFRHPQGVSAQVVNSGRNGGTAHRALEQFDRRVPEGADAVVIVFGANDVFYSGRAIGELTDDLVALAGRAHEMGARPIIVGMGAPSRDPDRPPSGVWADAAKRACADLYPFYFQALIDPSGRTLDPDMLQPDGLHPNAAGAEAVGRALARWMEQALARPGPCAER